MPITKRITIERYKNPSEDGYAGLIEGETDAGRRWIMWLGQDGSPEVYWPDRHEDGAVRGKPTVIWNEFDRRDWGTSDNPMTWEEYDAQPRCDGESEGKELQGGEFADSEHKGYAWHQFSGIFRALGVDDHDVDDRVISMFPAWTDGSERRAILFLVDPAAPEGESESATMARMLCDLTKIIGQGNPPHIIDGDSSNTDHQLGVVEPSP